MPWSNTRNCLQRKKHPRKNINHVIHLSNRFCSTHNPKVSTSKYRADLRYKKAFQHEVLALQFPISERSIFPATFKFTKGYEEELRKAAYDIVHSKLYANLHLFRENEALDKQLIKKSLSAQVLELKLQGLTQANIARKLGKTRQEVSRAYKKLKLLAHVT